MDAHVVPQKPSDNAQPAESNPTPYHAAVYLQVLVELRKIIQFSNLHSRALFKSTGLTGPQLVVLQEIGANDATAASKIAKATSLSQSTLTGILKRLEKRELISRSHSPEDRRKVLLSTTPNGDALLAAEPALMQESFVAAFGELPDWEQTMILSVLRRLVALMGYPALRNEPPTSDAISVMTSSNTEG